MMFANNHYSFLMGAKNNSFVSVRPGRSPRCSRARNRMMYVPTFTVSGASAAILSGWAKEICVPRRKVRMKRIRCMIADQRSP